MYMGTSWQGTITYPISFNIRDSAMEIAQLKTARETATDPRVFTAIDREIVVWMGQDPEAVLPSNQDPQLNLELHPTTTDLTRPEHIQQMIMEGYTDTQILSIHPEITQDDITAAKQQLLNIRD
jgi:hypothetical protein